MNQFLNIWFADVPAGAYGYSYQFEGERFSSDSVASLNELSDAIDTLETAEARGIWFRCTTLRSRPDNGRGTAEDTLAVPGVWADLDIAGPGHKHARLPKSEEEALEVLQRSGLPEPTMIVRTGGGFSAWWKFNEAVTDLAYATTVSQHVHELLTAASPELKIDNVSDLARVMRVPGTTNRKPGVNKPCELWRNSGAMYSAREIHAISERRPVQVPVETNAFEEASNPRPRSKERVFTQVEARAYVHEALTRLERAQDGEINVCLNAAAKQLSHFGPEFWPRSEAEGWLYDALARTEYDGSSWTASDTINSAYGSASGDWTAVLAGPARQKRKQPDVQPDFTDASLAEYVAGLVFVDKYIRTKGLGWLRWDGRLWRQCDDGAPVEAVRQFVKAKLIAAIKKDGIGSADAKGWAKYNSAGKITAVVSLAGNMKDVLRETTELDQHPDLINTPDGVLDLRSLDVVPHEPGLLLTKITKGSYRAGYTSTDFDMALTAVPEDALPWLRAHLGAGVSGRPKPRVPAVLLTGEGRNGKTLLMETAIEAMGGIDGEGYAAQVPNELLLLGKVAGGPSPERLALRGARLAYIEETPEGRYLDTQALKKVVGTGITSGRELYKSLVTFRMTHVLFVITNFPPRVSETDTATWDRLTALRFPYRFRKENDGLGPELENDRPASATLAEDLLQPKNLDAMFTWIVEGYRAGRTDQVAVPGSVRDAVSEWRKEGDLLLRFWEDTVVRDVDSWVSTVQLYAVLRRWCEVHGQKSPPPMNTFLSRLKAHTGITPRVEVFRTLTSRAGRSTPAGSEWLVEGKNMGTPTSEQTTGVYGVRFVSSAHTSF